ncbi:MAG: hypothetical protein IKZ88_05255 [Neisseriaceae bacterium]|nr:hypothetical protein [Neisseriaceae bacterium]
MQCRSKRLRRLLKPTVLTGLPRHCSAMARNDTLFLFRLPEKYLFIQFFMPNTTLLFS